MPNNPYSLSFAGNGGVISSSAGIVMAAPFTFGLFIKPPVTPAAAWFASRNAGAGDGFRVILQADGSVSVISETSGATLNKSSSVGLVKFGAWNFVAFVIDVGTGATFVNGKFETFTYTGTINANTGLQVGRYYVGNGFFTGLIDNPFVSSAALGQAELDRIMREGATASSRMVEWLFDEGSGTTANDNSGNSRAGTITNGTYSTDTPILANTGAAFHEFF